MYAHIQRALTRYSHPACVRLEKWQVWVDVCYSSSEKTLYGLNLLVCTDLHQSCCFQPSAFALIILLSGNAFATRIFGPDSDFSVSVFKARQLQHRGCSSHGTKSDRPFVCFHKNCHLSPRQLKTSRVNSFLFLYKQRFYPVPIQL